MAEKINIPARVVLENHSATLDLNFPARCSRCNAFPANYYETHQVKYEAGLINNRTFTKKFRTSKKISLRLPLCEACYQANFIENPDSCVKDQNKLGKIAHWHSVCFTTSSLVTGLAFILLMKVIPLPAEFPWLQFLWLMLIGMALLIFAISFGLLQLKNHQLRSSLKELNYDFQLHRAEVFAKMQKDDPQADDVAVTALLQNEDWAQECGDHYGWVCEKIISNDEQLEAK
jgi:hypothetical protein